MVGQQAHSAANRGRGKSTHSYDSLVASRDHNPPGSVEPEQSWDPHSLHV